MSDIEKKLAILEQRSQYGRSSHQADPRRAEKIKQRQANVAKSKSREDISSLAPDEALIEEPEYKIPAFDKSSLFTDITLPESFYVTEPETPAENVKPTEPEDSDSEEDTLLYDDIFRGKDKKTVKAEKKPEKKDRKQKSQAADTVLNDLAQNLADRKDKVSAVMAELMKTQEYLALIKQQLYIYDQKGGYFEKCDKTTGAMLIRSLIPPELQNRVAYSDYTQAYNLLGISNEIQKPDDFFSFNTPYTNCQNGVYDALSDTLLPKSPKYGFTNCLLARYDPDAKHPKWDEYLNYITGGDSELKKLWQVVLGYIFSNYNNAKVGILIYGAPHTGKSVLCNLIERFFGSNKVSHVDISMFCKPEFTTHTAGKTLNIVPDLKNDKLTDVGHLKSLLSHLDTISARALYNNPQEIKSQTKMLFATNHLLSFDLAKSSTNDVEAIFNRLLYIPFMNAPVPKSQENKHLADELWQERNGILSWALYGGLQEYIDRDENFPVAAKSQELKNRNVAQYCPEMIFASEYLTASEGEWVSSSKIRDAYSSYCMENGIARTKKLDILTYIEEHFGVQKEKGRVMDAYGNKSNCWHYKNLKLLWDSDDSDDEEELYDT